MTHVQLCGFQTVGPMMAAIEAGVDAIGLVFVPTARRVVTVAQAGALLEEARAAGGRLPAFVGLFGDQPSDEVNAIVDELGLDAVQLCGSEGMAYCARMTAPVHKVITIDPETPAAAQLPRVMVAQQRHALAGHRIVVDTQTAGQYGGGGRSFDWGLAADLARSFEMSLAGGLSPDNVAEAVERVAPWGVDASSGVETDGEKDPAKIKAFVETVRAVDRRSNPRGLRRLFGRG